MRECVCERERGGDLRGRVGSASAVRDRERAREAVSMRERQRGGDEAARVAGALFFFAVCAGWRREGGCVC